MYTFITKISFRFCQDFFMIYEEDRLDLVYEEFRPSTDGTFSSSRESSFDSKFTESRSKY